MMRTNFAPQARASRKSRSNRSSACSTVGRPASKLDRMTRFRALGKFSTDCEALQKRQVNACARIGFPQTSQSLVISIAGTDFCRGLWQEEAWYPEVAIVIRKEISN
jgi:hypothetical protein